MLRITFVTAAVLVLLGVGFYVGSGAASFTALIPAFIGAPIAACGGLACLRSPTWVRPAAMHVAMLVALVGLAGAGMGVPELVAWIGEGTTERPLAVVLMNVTALVLLAYLALGVRSFLEARKAKPSEGPAAAPADAEAASSRA